MKVLTFDSNYKSDIIWISIIKFTKDIDNLFVFKWMHPGFKLLFSTKFLDPKLSLIYIPFQNIPILHYNLWLFWFLVWVLRSPPIIFLFSFPRIICPPPALIDHFFYCHILVHVSRGLPANQPKTPLLPPVLIPKDDSKPGMGFLDYLGIFTLAAGSVAVLVLACCCYLKCFKNSSTMGPL